jgi:hypothetical protein
MKVNVEVNIDIGVQVSVSRDNEEGVEVSNEKSRSVLQRVLVGY